jgi:hypothetical protein
MASNLFAGEASTSATVATSVKGTLPGKLNTYKLFLVINHVKGRSKIFYA